MVVNTMVNTIYNAQSSNLIDDSITDLLGGLRLHLLRLARSLDPGSGRILFLARFAEALRALQLLLQQTLFSLRCDLLTHLLDLDVSQGCQLFSSQEGTETGASNVRKRWTQTHKN